jgi:hypothetical protein
VRTTLTAVVAILALLTTVSASALPGLDAGRIGPVMCAEDDLTPDGRVFPEPSLTATFLTFADLECGIELLQSRHPDRVAIDVLGESRGGAPIYDVVLTDESVPVEDKRHLLVLSSIHGNEHAGREGAARIIEDVLDQRADQPFIAETLQRFVVHVVFANPDGWINGDLTAAGGGANFTRQNDGSRDLNRNFPVIGFLRASNGTLDQPEGRAIDALLQRHADTAHPVDSEDYRGWYLGTDNHGQGAKPVAASGLQIVGQFDFGKSELLAEFADSISANIEGIALESIETLNGLTGGAVQPYEWGTLYDILGYSAAGSGIDYYNTPTDLHPDVPGIGGVGFATEMTASNLPFSNILTHPGPVNQMWVDTTRAIVYAMFKTAIAGTTYTFPVPEGVAYVEDPVPTSSDDEDGFGIGNLAVPATFTGDDPEVDPDFAFVPYEVSRMRFFEDLQDFAATPLAAVRAQDVVRDPSQLDGLSTLVLADEVMPAEGDVTDAEQAAWVAALDAFVEGGGRLVLTDGAAPLLAELVDGIGAGDVSRVTSNVGYVDFTALDTPAREQLNANLRGVASQTYDVVPIGYPDNGGAAPNWTVARTAWESAGGVTAGTTGTGRTSWGAIADGAGDIVFLGALLPEPTEDHFHPYGLQSYAVTYTGYELLANALALDPATLRP